MPDDDTTTAAECPDYCRCGCPERWAPEPRWPLADASTAGVLNSAVELGADALWGNRNRNAAVPSSPGPDYADRLMARVVIGAAAPGIAAKAAADERERIRHDLIDGDPGRLEAALREVLDDEEASDAALIVAGLLDGTDAS